MTQVTELPTAIEARLRALPQGLRDHVQRARRVAGELARRHGVDEARADLGAAGHDIARAVKGEVLLEEAKRYGIRVHPVERHSPILLHGRIAALWLEREDGVTDTEVLQAVRWHTTGRKDMGQVAKVVFLADKLDPHKVERYAHLAEVEALAHKSLDRAILEYVNSEMDYLLRRGYPIHPATLGLRNQLLMGLVEP